MSTKNTQNQTTSNEPRDLSETMRPTVMRLEDLVEPPPEDHWRLRMALAMGVGVIGAIGLFVGYAAVQDMAGEAGAVGRAVGDSRGVAAPAAPGVDDAPETAWSEGENPGAAPFDTVVAVDALTRAAVEAKCVGTTGPVQLEVEAKFAASGALTSVRVIDGVGARTSKCLSDAWKGVTIAPFDGFPESVVRASVRVR